MIIKGGTKELNKHKNTPVSTDLTTKTPTVCSAVQQEPTTDRQSQ